MSTRQLAVLLAITAVVTLSSLVTAAPSFDIRKPPTGMAAAGELEDQLVTIEPAARELDFGDAPEGALAYPANGAIGQFPTCMQAGPAGWIQHTNFGGWFGPMVDFEPDGNAGLCPLFSPSNYDRDECCHDSDAGLLFPAAYTIQGPPGHEVLVPCSGLVGPLGLTCQRAVWGANADIHIHNWMPNHEPYVIAYVNVLMDWDQDGKWSGASSCATAAAPEHVLVDFPIPAKYDGPLSALNPPGFLIGPNPGYVWTRFSITERPVGQGWDGSGMFEDGESEDYLLLVDGQPQERSDFGDAPDQPYPTLAANGGAFHVASPGFCLGAAIDTEADGQPTIDADGDDVSPTAVDDEDGVVLNTPLFPGGNATITVTTNIPAGAAAFLDVWVDWAADGNWATPGDQIFTALPVANGPNVLNLAVPAGAAAGTKTYARFRLSSNPKGLPFTGGWADGEVEDYQIGIGYKWDQKPDLDVTGVDVSATIPRILADDFLCKVAGPITDIHIWGSWKHDILPGDLTGISDPSLVTFVLSIHKDIPAGTGDIPYSRPGELLWYRVFQPGTFVVHPYFQGNEWWWDPIGASEPEFPGDHVVWHYDFFVTQDPFYQQGTPEKPVVYWLDLQAVPGGSNGAEFGWKTCVPEDRWNDDAVVGIGQDPGGDISWRDLHYPVPHPLAPESLDLAFALTGYAEERDWGDAPDPTYPTLAASNGASHKIVPGFMLGNIIDSEPDGQPNASATGDDMANLPDEDGVLGWPLLVPGQVVTVPVLASVPLTSPAYLDAWIDFGNDGSWATPGDQVAFIQPVVNGPNPITFLVPRTLTWRAFWTHARLRLSTCPNGLPFFGPWSDGEVEDYWVLIQPDHGSLTFSQATAIKDHFWWRSDPDAYNEMLSLKAGTDLVEPVSWDSVTLSLAGGAAGDIARIEVWRDNDANDAVDPTVDTPLGAAVGPVSPVTIPLAGAVIPANSSIRALITYTLSPAAAIGNVYSFQMVGATGTGQLSGLPADIFGLPISSCRKIVVPPPISIGQAKLQPVGSTVFLKGKICTAAFAPWNLFYIEEPDRSAGIGVQFTGVSSPATQDQLVSLLGRTLLLDTAELVIVPIQLEVGPTLLPPITPVGMNNKWTGGGMFGGQPAVYDDAPAGRQAMGLSNVGMLVRTWGKVMWHDSAFTAPTVSGPFFWINDGSNLNDGLRLTPSIVPPGVACYYGFVGHPGSFPDIGEYWGVTGILRAIPSPGISGYGVPVRLLVPRSFPEDLTEYPLTTTP